VDFPKPIFGNRFGKSVSRNERNNCSLLLLEYEGYQNLEVLFFSTRLLRQNSFTVPLKNDLRLTVQA